MSNEMLVTIITGLFTLIGVIITCVTTNAKTQWRIEQLEKKQDKHNQIIERVYKLEQVVTDIKEEMK